MRLIALSLGAALLLGACVAPAPSSSPPSPSLPPSASASPPPSLAASPEYDHSPAALLLRMSIGGGFVAPVALFGRAPTFSLFGDGRLVRLGVTTMQYPGPALPALRETRLAPSEIEAVLGAAEAAGLLHNATYDAAGIADAATTIFETNLAGGRHYQVSAYALGLEGASLSGGPDPAAEARAKLTAFADQLADPATLLGRQLVDTPYEAAAVRLRFGPMTLADPAAPTETAQVWPLATSLAALGGTPGPDGMRCVALAGVSAATVLAAAAQATEITPWTSAGQTYQIAFRPLLPDEQGCPA